MEFHVLVLLLMVIYGYAGISTAGQILPPRITPFGEDFVTVPKTKHRLTNSSRPFRLLCEGQKPVNWTFPAPHMFNFEASIKNISSWEQTSNIDYPYAAHLFVEQASYDDTGYYHCSYNTSTLEPDATSNVYVFVRDESQLLVGDNPHTHNTYHVMQYKSVWFDCRPTSPDVKVSLWLDDVRIDAGTTTTESHGMKVTFDPTQGFHLENVNINNDNADYECKGERGGTSEEFTINLSVLAHSDSMAKPRITGGSIVAVGGELIMNCTVMVEVTIYFSMSWTVPDPTAITAGRIYVNTSKVGYDFDPNGVRKKVGSSVLRILRASMADLGNYTCKVEDHAGNGNTATRFVNVISSL